MLGYRHGSHEGDGLKHSDLTLPWRLIGTRASCLCISVPMQPPERRQRFRVEPSYELKAIMIAKKSHEV